MTQAAIQVKALGERRYAVEVQAAETTVHEVTIPTGYPEVLGLAGCQGDRLVQESFRFLLEREPNSSILRSFPLSSIERYFPEYRSEIGRRLREGRGQAAGG